jgi:hypothetical protein
MPRLACAYFSCAADNDDREGAAQLSMLIGIYSGGLVLVSLFVAMFASHTTLDMAGRITVSQTRFAACLWLGGGSFAMGLGIWSMHFIGMLAYKLPVPMSYDVRITSSHIFAPGHMVSCFRAHDAQEEPFCLCPINYLLIINLFATKLRNEATLFGLPRLIVKAI